MPLRMRLTSQFVRHHGEFVQTFQTGEQSFWNNCRQRGIIFPVRAVFTPAGP